MSQPTPPTAVTIPRRTKERHLLNLSEATFRDEVVRPLFLLLDFRDGRDLCGPMEAGKDALFILVNNLGQQDVYVVQTKKGNITLAATASKNLYNLKAQLRTALDAHVILLNPHRKVYPAKAILCVSGRINEAAKSHICDDLNDPRLSFMDADDLIPLVDAHYSEFWLGVDAKLAPYLRALRRGIEAATRDFHDASPTHAAAHSPATDDMFVPIHVTRVSSRVVKRSGRVEREPFLEDAKIQELLHRPERRILLLGAAGTGKTTCLRRLAYLAATQALSSDAPPTIPILLKAREVATDPHPLVEQCDTATRRLTTTPQPAFGVPDLEAGRLCVMIDALDEVAAIDQRQHVISTAAAFSQRYSKCQIIMTSRPLSSLYSLAQIDHFEEFSVSPIGVRSAQQMVTRLHRKGNLSPKHTSEILRRLQSVHGMELSPLLVTVFVSTTEYERRDIPANITELFKKYTEMMLGRWDATKGMGLQYQASLKDFVIQQVALAMHQKRETDIELVALKARIATELADRGHEASVDILTTEIVERSGLFRQNGERVEFRHHILQEFFAGRALSSQAALEPIISDDWWRRAVVFYFGENPSDGRGLEAARTAVCDRSAPERCNAALTLGLALQACYLVEVGARREILAWTIATLAMSQKEFVDVQVEAGRGPLLSLLRFYLVGRDSVGAQILGLHHEEVAQLARVNPDLDEDNIAEFWVIVGLVEAGFLKEAESRIERFSTDDNRLRYMLYLSCLLLRQTRTTSKGDRKIADRIGALLSPYVQGQRDEILKEYSSELLELRGAHIKRIDTQPESGDDQPDTNS